VDLSEDDKALIAEHIARGEPLPDRFRWMLFREPREAELIWPGNLRKVT
jgi:adenine-specific DNA-methyltransferase